MHILLDSRLTLEDSFDRLQITGVCDQGRIRDGFVCVSGHKCTYRNDTKTGLERHPKLI